PRRLHPFPTRRSSDLRAAGRGDVATDAATPPGTDVATMTDAVHRTVSPQVAAVHAPPPVRLDDRPGVTGRAHLKGTPVSGSRCPLALALRGSLRVGGADAAAQVGEVELGDLAALVAAAGQGSVGQHAFGELHVVAEAAQVAAIARDAGAAQVEMVAAPVVVARAFDVSGDGGPPVGPVLLEEVEQVAGGAPGVVEPGAVGGGEVGGRVELGPGRLSDGGGAAGDPRVGRRGARAGSH